MATSDSLREQLAGTWGNFVDTVRRFRADDFLFPWVVSTINWFIGLIPDSLGLRDATPYEQVRANVLLAAFEVSLTLTTIAIIAPIVTVTLVVHAALLLAAVLRLVPAVNGAWEQGRSWIGLDSDYDIPLWRSE
jgi:hypothetical protein